MKPTFIPLPPMTQRIAMSGHFRVICMCIAAVALAAAGTTDAADTSKPVKVFILAGDANCLEQGVSSGRTEGKDAVFLPNEKPEKDEVGRHVNCAVYKGSYKPGTDFDKLTPEWTGIVGLGENLSMKKKSRPFALLPELATKEGYTTVLRGYLSVPRTGRYEIQIHGDDGAFNITTVDGKEMWRREPGQERATVTALALEKSKRYPVQTIFLGKPGQDYRVPQVGMPGTLETLMADQPDYAFLKEMKREDVTLYDAHPIHNNTRAAGTPLQLTKGVGPEMMLGKLLGDHFDEQVFLLRFATTHTIWNPSEARSLGHDYMPPSSGGDPDLSGTWDVIHFNHGVWDATYRDSTSKYFSGHNITSVEDFEKNLRILVGKMKKTGATLIWGTVTPVWPGEPGRLNADEDAFNKVAEKVMKENGVIINDLNAETRRQGQPKTNNVHDVGNLAPLVTKTIEDALATRPKNTKPLPRVLMIGDSITGGYLGKVTQNLDGKAVVFKNPGNAEDTWNGLEQIDRWLDLKTYLQSGQEYLELVNAVNDSLAQLPRFLPGYQNQGYELAGMVWFQGIADSQSPAQKAAYERNLANLIQDLRRDLKAPKLPVVVAAVAYDDGKIHAAQMAVGDPAKHPEFAGNVVSIDTKPFLRGAEQSPGGYATAYYSNARSFLEIGEAFGKALLEIQKSNTK
ncbi:MAG TPA: sialate O-acetylesterase [Luteolibacter sp.]|nr:sialate O-acetylesterase [Luteolibacter sp.]